MNFNLEDFPNQFYLKLIKDIENFEYLKEINDRYDKLIVFNPEYILTVYQILMSVNKAYHNFFSVKKKKAGSIKKEIIYFLTDKKKVDESSKLHEIKKENKEYFLLFIDFEKDEITNISTNLKGQEINLNSSSSLCNTSEIKKEFEVTENEILTENGLIGCIYNKIALKDLK